MNLAVVIPVYNEEKTIQPLLRDLVLLLKEENISYDIFIINDGSSDDTLSKIKSIQNEDSNINVISKTNSGHGPSLFVGYSLAVDYDWVLQIDSDYAYNLSAFQKLWSVKEGYDLLLAERNIKAASFLRNVITIILRTIVILLYGRGVNDVNVPYRLIRGSKLKDALEAIKPNQFAPNVLMTAFFIKKKFRIFLSVAEIRKNAIIRQSMVNRYILKGCIKSVLDVIIFRSKI
jgi:glycosyltransferase involved in cell wall biosynthesis